jgi:hypothetical protein
MTLPKFITFTGADDHTSLDGMVELSALYPIEWGLLFSPKRQGSGRYPTLRTIKRFTDVPLDWSAHLCGRDARAVIDGGESPHDDLLIEGFVRSQINTADPNVQPSMIRQWADRLSVAAILQCRGAFPDVSAVQVLFDASGGRGVSPSDWPRGLPRLCGYAGGLGPNNVADAVSIIGARASDYWIDMETGVRDENDRFSLEKCRLVCEAVYG